MCHLLWLKQRNCYTRFFLRRKVKFAYFVITRHIKNVHTHENLHITLSIIRIITTSIWKFSLDYRDIEFVTISATVLYSYGVRYAPPILKCWRKASAFCIIYTNNFIHWKSLFFSSAPLRKVITAHMHSTNVFLNIIWQSMLLMIKCCCKVGVCRVSCFFIY